MVETQFRNIVVGTISVLISALFLKTPFAVLQIPSISFLLSCPMLEHLGYLFVYERELKQHSLALFSPSDVWQGLHDSWLEAAHSQILRRCSLHLEKGREYRAFHIIKRTTNQNKAEFRIPRTNKLKISRICWRCLQNNR